MSLLGYWAKTKKNGSSVEHHPLLYHVLDVAAAGAELLRVRPRAMSQLADVGGLEADALASWLCFLLATHDLGKMADGFQGQAKELQARLQGRTSGALYLERHDLLGFRLWAEVLGRELHEEILPFAEPVPYHDWWDLVAPWIWATAGHHGVPPRRHEPEADLEEQFPAPVRADAREMVETLAALLLPGGIPFGPEPRRQQLDRFRRASWLVAGLAVTADWIGSNVAWFPFTREEMAPAEYWREIAQPRARNAVLESGAAAPPASAPGGVTALWPAITTPTDLQLLAASVELGTGPQLFVVEEVTGGGKTEAAFALAHRLMAAGGGSGIFVALPTMATANAMHERVGKVYRRLFGAGAEPSLVLAHGKSHLALPMEAVGRDDGEDETSGGSGSGQAAAWLADSRKKALLATVGVGTIDQALLGVLPVRHQSLRLWGLAGKILIVDEVHACDDYVRTLLSRLLEFHAGFGGSAILLSATLPAGQRKELVEAFRHGVGGSDSPPDDEVGRGPEAYPLTTHWSCGYQRAYPTEARREAIRRVEVRRVSSEEDVHRLLAEALDGGKCACWIRNTVGDARRAFRFWSERLGRHRVILFHSRFTVGDRAAIEAEVLRRFGSESRAPDRGGRLLIATQVVEQSLDLDFDFMVSDLAPIDLVVQRAGRLLRHHRTAAGDRTAGPDGRGAAILVLLAPEPRLDVGEDWFEVMFPAGAWVYPDHGRLWLTARWLEAHGGFRMPEDARDLIESVYGGASGAEIPKALRERTDKASQGGREDQSLAHHNALMLRAGYCTRASRGGWGADEYTPTRLGAPSVDVLLAREEGGRVVPWHAGLDHPWERSSVKMPRSHVAGEDPGLVSPSHDELPGWLRRRGPGVVIAVLGRGDGETWKGWARSLAGEAVRLSYARVDGLEVTNSW